MFISSLQSIEAKRTYSLIISDSESTETNVSDISVTDKEDCGSSSESDSIFIPYTTTA